MNEIEAIEAIDAAVKRATEKAEEYAMLYRSLEDTELPASLKEASETGWELNVIDAVNLGRRLAYDRENRRKDKTRLIPLRVALQVMEEMEEELVRTQVLDPLQLLWNKGEAIYKAVTNWADIIQVVIIAATQGILAVIVQYLSDEAMTFVEAFALVHFEKTMKTMFATRDSMEVRMRSRALPQNPVTAARRTWRRKVTRR